MALTNHRRSSFRFVILFIVLVLFSLFIIPRPVNGNDNVDASVAVPLQAPLPSSESGGLSMIERLGKKISQSNDKKEEKMMITAAVAAEEETEKAEKANNNNENKASETVNNAPDQSTTTPSESINANEKKPEEIEHREFGAGRALVNAVWFIVIITVIPCLLCTCLLSCLCYMMEWIPNPFSGEYYSSGPYGGGGIWGTGTRTGTGWYGQGSTA